MSANNLNELVNKNQSIKIVPSIEDFLLGMGLDVHLDDNIIIWFEQLKETWKIWMKNHKVEKHIELFFSSIIDPFRVALVLVIKSEGFKDCKPKSLPFFIIETLQKWSIENNTSPEDTLKLPAFHIGIQQRNTTFLKLIAKTYNVNSIKEIIVPMVKDMIKNDNCKIASQIIIAAELFQDIPVEELLFPLILQDKANLIDEYLSECPSQVHSLLDFLDKLLDKRVNLKEYAYNYIQENNIHNVKAEKIHHKPFGRLVARLCNKFNVPIEYCKNLSKNRTTGGLKYLIYQKYVEHNVSSSVWDDLVKDSLRQNAESAQEFIDRLVDFDRTEAHKWASYLNMAERDLPLALKDMSLQVAAEEENWDSEIGNNSQGYYKLNLDEKNINMIDTGEKFYDLMIKLKDCKVVGIDCEWKPSFGAKQSQVALIQIATHDNVYLIDTMVLNNTAHLSFWHTFYKSLLDNAEIIKVGFGLEIDLKEIKNSIIGLGNIKVKDEGLLDMATLWKNLINVGISLPNSDENSGNSLSYLVQSCFGLPLEKSEQCSNWELRPLRKTQIYYAALDAYVLIEIYNFLEKKCNDQKINFEEVCNNTMTESKKKTVKRVRGHERVQFIPSIPPKSTHEIKFLVEAKLSPLLSYLRYCGIDTIVTPNNMLWCDIVNLAATEDRLILLNQFKGTPSASFSQSSILDVGTCSIMEQMHIVLNRFNIIIKQNDLLKICMKCNERDLKILSPDDVYQLCKDYECSISTNYQHENVDYDDNEPNYDRFLSDSDGDEDLYQMVPTAIQPKKTLNTAKGAVIQISNIHKLSESNKAAVLCESCGALFWGGDELTKSVIDTIFSLTKLSNTKI